MYFSSKADLKAKSFTSHHKYIRESPRLQDEANNIHGYIYVNLYMYMHSGLLDMPELGRGGE